MVFWFFYFVPGFLLPGTWFCFARYQGVNDPSPFGFEQKCGGKAFTTIIHSPNNRALQEWIDATTLVNSNKSTIPLSVESKLVELEFVEAGKTEKYFLDFRNTPFHVKTWAVSDTPDAKLTWSTEFNELEHFKSSALSGQGDTEQLP